jgi:chloramphenicol O-acetyltransferase type A
MKHKLDIAHWNRKTHFEFFRKFEEPFFGITTIIDCTKAYEKAKQNKISFFIYYLHKTLQAVNAIVPFRYRIVDNEVIVYDTVNASATIMRDDTTFGFSLIDYFEDMTVFNEKAKLEIERVRAAEGLITRDFNGHYNLIHFSSLPWVNFTSISHSKTAKEPWRCRFTHIMA